MASRRNIYIEGLPEILRDLKNLDLKKQTLSRAAKAGAEIAKPIIEAETPVDSGDLKGTVKLKEGKSTDKKGIWTVKIGPKKYTLFQEAGTKKNKEKRYIRKSFDDNKEAIIDAVETVLNAEIDKILRRGF